MKKLCMILATAFCLVGCSADKEPLAPTQIVDGKSIVMPPEFYVLPKTQQPAPQQTEQTK